MGTLFSLLFIACNNEQKLEERYQEGYSEGQSAGYDDGYTEGQDAGYQAGLDTGLQQGYDSGYDDGYTDATTVEDGWDLYNQGNYAEACSSFLYQSYDTGINTDNATGLCWCNLRLWNITVAKVWFEMAVALEESNEEAWVGLGSAHMLSHDYHEAVAYSSTIEDIDVQSLLTAQVLAHLFLKDSAQVAITLYELAPEHQLHALDTSSWQVDGVNYHSFDRAVLATLQQLGVI